MSKEEKREAEARRNREEPPFTFRFATAKMKRDVERSAKKTHRTMAGVINRAIEVYLQTSKGKMV